MFDNENEDLNLRPAQRAAVEHQQEAGGREDARFFPPDRPVDGAGIDLIVRNLYMPPARGPADGLRAGGLLEVKIDVFFSFFVK
jgi:hypothetical protein